MAMPRPLNLAQRSTTIGAAQPLPPLAALQQAAAPPQTDPTYARRQAMAAALDGTGGVESGSVAEAVAEALAGGLRGRAAYSEAQRDESRYADALTMERDEREREQRQQGFDNDLRVRSLDQSQSQFDARQGQDQTQFEASHALTRRGQDLTHARGSGGGMSAPPSGYRWTANGDLEPVPGGPAATRGTTQQAQRASAAMARLDDAQNVLGAIQRARTLAGSGETGAVGHVMRNVPGTDAFNLDAELDVIRANIGFDALAEMRANSPTGGALGQVTERELAFLQAVMANLSQSQSREQFLSALDRLEQQYSASMARVREAYQQDFGQPMPAASNAPAPGGFNNRPRGNIRASAPPPRPPGVPPEAQWDSATQRWRAP